MNMRDVLDKQHYLQLKHINTAYCNTKPIQILEHLDTRWCPLDQHAKKLLKAEFHTNWDSSLMHLTAFGMKLDKEQACIDRLGVVISTKTNSNSTWSKSTHPTVLTKKNGGLGKQAHCNQR
jgi:hypothetical protein